MEMSTAISSATAIPGGNGERCDISDPEGGHEAELLFSEEPPWERFPVQIPFGNEGGKQMFRTLELSERGTELSFGSDCLVISGTEDKEGKIPLEELEAVILMEPAIRTSGVLLAELANRRIPLIVCDRRYLTSGVLCPLYREGREFFHVTGLQMRAAKPLRKRLWRSIVRSKIAGQAGNLKHFRSDCSLEGMEHLVCSGDSGNLEANAAHRYWSGLGLFPRRDRLADDANGMFNYVYAVLYAAVARRICSAAMNPHIGLHHRNQDNPFCLASDLMEPFRPYADRVVLALLCADPEGWRLTPERKAEVMRGLHGLRLLVSGERLGIFDAVGRMVVSYKRALEKNDAALLLLPDAEEG